MWGDFDKKQDQRRQLLVKRFWPLWIKLKRSSCRREEVAVGEETKTKTTQMYRVSGLFMECYRDEEDDGPCFVDHRIDTRDTMVHWLKVFDDDLCSERTDFPKNPFTLRIVVVDTVDTPRQE